MKSTQLTRYALLTAIASTCMLLLPGCQRSEAAPLAGKYSCNRSIQFAFDPNTNAVEWRFNGIFGPLINKGHFSIADNILTIVFVENESSNLKSDANGVYRDGIIKEKIEMEWRYKFNKPTNENLELIQTYNTATSNFSTEKLICKQSA